MNSIRKYNEWLNDPYFDDEFHKALEELEDEKEIEDRFYKYLDFGTAGMRGIIGAGTNRMNRYIIRRATQGFADYLKDTFKSKNLKIAIAYDPRNKSELFTKEAALVMAANGIKAYIYSSLKATPQLSYTVRKLKCHGGIMITASHNPAEYNGYKVYDETGCQLVPEKGNKLKKFVNKIDNFNEVKIISEKKAMDNELLEYIDSSIIDSYISKVKSLSLREDLIESTDLKIIFSPLHGAGGEPIKRVLTEMGLKNLILVEEQMVPDGNFSTIKNPNPESEKAFEYALKYGEKYNGDLLICTDPDSDRVGLMVRTKEDTYKSLNGNQIGILLLEYLLSSYENTPKGSYVVNSIVTSGIVKSISAKYKVDHRVVLTGFKYIGEMIEKDNGNFIFGFEESYGYLTGTFVRDKDAVIATMLIVEMAAYYSKNNVSLLEKLDSIYKEYGYFSEEMIAVKHEGKTGEERIKNILSSLREGIVKILNGENIVEVIDCLEEKKTGLPKANVLKYFFDDGSWIAIRPSGTEPKIKFYFSIKGDTKEESKIRLKSIKKDFFEILDRI